MSTLPSLLPGKPFPTGTSRPRAPYTSYRVPVPAGSPETLCDSPPCACVCSPPACLQPSRGARESLVPGTSGMAPAKPVLGSRGHLWVLSQRMDRSQQEEASSCFLPRLCSAQADPAVARASDLSSPPALLPVTDPPRTPGCSRMQPWGDAELCWKRVYLHPLPCQRAGCRTGLG